MEQEPRYVPAAGRDLLTPAYDLVVRLTMREGTFRPRLVAAVGEGLPAAGAGARLLEVGCGTGALTAMLAEALPVAAVWGLDGDPRVLGRARARLRPLAGRAGGAVELAEGNAAELPYGDASFDRVVASLLLHHLDDATKARALAEAARVLRPGGRLHVADWGRPQGIGPRLGFAALRLLDGRANTRIHAEGRLEEIVHAVGFGRVESNGSLATVWGTLELLTGYTTVKFA